MKTLRSSVAPLLVASLSLTVAGCGGGGGSASGPGNPTFRFVNGSPDSTNLDLLQNDNVVAGGLAYGSASTAFQSIAPGDYDVAIEEHGSTTPLWSESDTLPAGGDFVFVAIGQENYGAEPLKRARIAVVGVDRTAPNGNKARIVFVHAFARAAGFETPSIDIQNPGATPLYKISGLAFGQSQSIDVDSGVQTFVAEPTTTDQGYVQKDLTVEAGKIYLAIVDGIEGDTGAQAPDIKLIPIAAR